MFLGFPGGSDSKEPTCSAGDLSSIPELGRSAGGGHGSPLQYSCLENPRGQRSLAGYSPGDHKELDTTERLSTAQHSVHCMYVSQFVLSVHDSEHLHCFQFWSIANKVPMNIHTQGFVLTCTYISFGWIPRNRMAMLHGRCMSNFLRNGQTVV